VAHFHDDKGKGFTTHVSSVSTLPVQLRKLTRTEFINYASEKKTYNTQLREVGFYFFKCSAGGIHVD